MIENAIIYQENGQLIIVIPAISLERSLEKDIPIGKEAKIISIDTLPKDRVFRDAWVLKDNSVIEDLEKSKTIWLNNLRQKRNKKLEELDRQILIALEKGETLDQLKIAKQKLRDLPQSVDLSKIKNIEELKQLNLL